MCDLSIATSIALTLVGSLSALSPVAVSSGVPTAAVFVTAGRAASPTLTVSVIGGAELPAAIAAVRVQVTSGGATPQVHPEPLAET